MERQQLGHANLEHPKSFDALGWDKLKKNVLSRNASTEVPKRC